MSFTTIVITHSAQVRQEDASPGYLPTICLTSGVDEICTRLDTEFTENPMGWQWVELYADLLAQGPLVQRTMQVSLFARGNTVNSRDGRVFFDNICLETFHGMVCIIQCMMCKYKVYQSTVTVYSYCNSMSCVGAQP